MFEVRMARATDFQKIYALYKKVAAAPFGIARAEDEITDTYINGFMQQAANSGLEFVIDNPENSDEVVAEIHCYKMGPRIFSHVLGELTIAVHPAFQGRGLGRMIFTALLRHIITHRTDIGRVELFTQETNVRALALYKSIGFVPEGRFEKRVPGANNRLEADIPMAWFNPSYIAPLQKNNE